MVIIQNKTGQLANRLFVFSHFIANAIEHNYKLLNPTFDEYSRYFPRVRNNDFPLGDISARAIPGLPYPLFKWVSRALFSIIRKSPWHLLIEDSVVENSFDLGSPEFVREARSGKFLFMRGWDFRDFKNHWKHRYTIREIFAPDPSVLEWTRERLADARMAGARVIGVHVRRGDYAVWEGGRYYFDNHDYMRWMKQMDASGASDGVKTVFFMCSNDDLSPDDFPGLEVRIPKGDLIEDLYLLSGCDYLIGPPSTYSLWASFYGDVPLLHLREKQQSADLAMFEKTH